MGIVAGESDRTSACLNLVSKTEEGLCRDDGRSGVHNWWREPWVSQHPPIAVRGMCRHDNLLRLGKGVWSPKMLRISVARRALLRHGPSF
ncbi:hypothetical protein BHE74_00039077 [Ensete ventricosum]|uniref:Uncharacterized protein n=1 Tax=Ensete ventricosum TaxID=4639 RepID=A0A445MEU2_ENSVE|nr:hypothetical protein BHE74_00039077 [Ensete ventricosum]RZR72708.1 hypothetical protein BHM03_00016033 [Ensete ventricosum]